MQSALKLMTEALGSCPLVANVTENMGECTTYDVTVTDYDGITRRLTMKVRIFTATMLRGLELETALDRALVVPGDRPLTETVLSCVRNGGGWLNDADRHIRICYYDMLIKDINTEGMNHGQ